MKSAIISWDGSFYAFQHGETCVHMAASGGSIEVMKFLQSKNVDINATDKHGDGAVYWAARQGHTEMIMFLEQEGCSLETQNKSGETAAHVAARYGHVAVIEYLVSAGVDINVQDNVSRIYSLAKEIVKKNETRTFSWIYWHRCNTAS